MSGKGNAAPAEKPADKGAETAEPKKAGGGMLLKVGIIAGGLIVLATGALLLVAFVIAPKLRASGPAPTATPAGEVAEGEAKGDAAHGDAKGAEHGKGAHAHGEIIELGDIVVNPAGTGGRRYLKASVSIEVKNAKVAKLVEERTAPVKDLLIRDLSERTLEELTDAATKEEMRESLVEKINGLFPDGTVLNVFFTEYVVQ